MQGDVAPRMSWAVRGVRARARRLEVAFGRVLKWRGRFAVWTSRNGRHELKDSFKEGTKKKMRGNMDGTMFGERFIGRGRRNTALGDEFDRRQPLGLVKFFRPWDLSRQG